MHHMPRTIVCFGDSLTAGFQSPSRANPEGRATPYGETLQERLGPRACVRTAGICGELTGEMVLRLTADALRYRPTVVVILGGTNDLGWNATPAEIMGNLALLYGRTVGAEAIPVAVTVPSIRIEDLGQSPDASAYMAEHVDRRDRLNRLIRAYAARTSIPCFDLFEATLEPGNRMLAAAYCNDGLHFSTAGYRRFGTELYEQIFAPRLAQWFPVTDAP